MLVAKVEVQVLHELSVVIFTVKDMLMWSTTGRMFQHGRNLAAVSLGIRANSGSAGTQIIVPFCNSKAFSSLPPLPGDTSKEPFIPAYQQVKYKSKTFTILQWNFLRFLTLYFDFQRQNESIDTLKARLLYQSRKRGMLENGLLLSTFAAKFLNSMNELELKDYDRLINLPSNDWDIFYWATGVKPIPKEFDTAVLHKFIEHVRNGEKECRIRQPDL